MVIWYFKSCLRKMFDLILGLSINRLPTSVISHNLPRDQSLIKPSCLKALANFLAPSSPPRLCESNKFGVNHIALKFDLLLNTIWSPRHFAIKQYQSIAKSFRITYCCVSNIPCLHRSYFPINRYSNTEFLLDPTLCE